MKLRFVVNKLAEIFSRPWSDLRGISNSYAAKSTILIPLIGYWVIFNDSMVRWLNLAREFVGAPDVDGISSRLLWTYLALCSIAFGTLIYAWRCPTEVKKYGDYRDYVNGDGPAMSNYTMEDIEGSVRKAGYVLDGSIAKADYLELHYLELNSSRPLSRLLVLLFYAYGFLVVTYFSARVFLKVIEMLVTSPTRG